MNEEQNEEIIIEEEEEENEILDNVTNNQKTLELLKSELDNKSKLLKKALNENKNLRKKCKELTDLAKKKNTKTNKTANDSNDLLKWKCTWEKVITLITEIVPFTIPKKTNPDQQRKILYELTNHLCQIAKNSTQTIEYQHLKNKYEKNKKKLIKLKEQCNSLLDIIQSRKYQSNYINRNYYANYDSDDDAEILYNNDYEFNNHQKRTKYKFNFNPVHDDIILNYPSKEREDSPLIYNQYSDVKNNCNINFESKSKISKSKDNSSSHLNSPKKNNISKNQTIKTQENTISENSLDSNKSDEHLSHSSKNEKHKNKLNQETSIKNSPTKHSFSFTNNVIIDVKSNLNDGNFSKSPNDLLMQSYNQSKENILKVKDENSQSHNFIEIQEASKIENQKNDLPPQNTIDSNPFNEFNAIINQEFSDNEAEEVLNELESMKSSSNTDNEAQQKTLEKQEIGKYYESNENYNTSQNIGNTKENKKYSKKVLLDYKIRQGRNMNELIDVTNKLREQYYKLSKRFGHTDSEFSKENDITFIRDSLTNQ